MDEPRIIFEVHGPTSEDMHSSIWTRSALARARASLGVMPLHRAQGRYVMSGLALFILVEGCVALGQPGERIKIILTGRAYEGSLLKNWFANEPMMDPIAIPSRSVPGGLEEGKRYIRLYFPRTYDRLAQYEFVIFEGTEMEYFTPTQQRWFHDAIKEHGMGGLNSRSVLSAIYYPQWIASVTQLAFPNDVDAVIASPFIKFGVTMEIVLNEDPNLKPVLLMFRDKPIKWKLTRYDAMVVVPRPGATIWSWIRGPYPELSIPWPGYTPHLISWKYGNGTTWTVHDRTVNWWQDVRDANPYGLDMIMNMVLDSTGRHIPGDIDLIHSIRKKFTEFAARKKLVISTIEFGEKFGASMERTEARLTGLEKSYLAARDTYVHQREAETWEMLDRLIEDSRQTNEVAMKELNQALLWIHIINWLVVCATFMSSGFVLWSLMVRRRLFREVASTRLGS